LNSAHFRVAEELARLEQQSDGRALELFRHGTLLVKLYAPRGEDPQTPHTRDEIYVVAQGSGLFFNGETRTPFGPGDWLFAAAQWPHRFENFTDDLAVWVMYYGPEGGEQPVALP
jgi:mannose-6-phosphate isomerase-like protein (cupin superfamily)